MLTVEIGVADLAATRFAISPLAETIHAVRLLGTPGRSAVNRPWEHWARALLATQPLQIPRLWPLIVNGLTTYPEFLLPAPAGRSPAFGDELERFRATPADAVRASLRRVFGEGTWPDTATELFARPASSLHQISAEIAECHERLVAPHWHRIRAVLDADISYRGGMLATGGARALFSDLHQDVRWAAGTLSIADHDGYRETIEVRPEPGGLVLMPGVFIWPEPSVRKATSSQTTITYPARGAATAWHATAGGGAAMSRDRALPWDPGDGSVGTLIGPPRARLLAALRAPSTTTTLARGLGVTPGAVSHHLTALRRCGLVDCCRSGRAVLYQTTDLGLALLGQDRQGS